MTMESSSENAQDPSSVFYQLTAKWNRLEVEMLYLFALQFKKGLEPQIMSHHLCDIYENVLRKKLNLESYGFSNISDLLNRIKVLFAKESLNEYGKYYFTLKSDYYWVCKTMMDNIAPDIFYGPNFKDRIPPDFMRPGHELPPVETGYRGFRPCQLFEVYLTNVVDPSMFFMRIKRAHSQFSEMMNGLKTFYSDPDTHDYTLRECDVKEYAQEALVIAARMTDDAETDAWHRAVVVNQVEGQKVKLYFVDHGTLGVTMLSNCRFLHNRFSQEPIQAFRGRLYNLEPPLGRRRWPAEATSFLKSYVYCHGSRNLPLDAEVKGVNRDNWDAELIVELVEDMTNGLEEGKNISDHLIKNNLADRPF